MAGGVWLLTGDEPETKNDRSEASRAQGSGSEGDAPARRQEREPAKSLEPPPCPPDLTNCVSATGRVVYVEKVDPDGDGDAHFVTVSKESVTGPGLTIFDVRTDLRPDPLPGVGDLVGGAGPVYPGSRGQKQIEVVAFEVAK